MAIDAIGTTLSATTADMTQSSLDQADFIKLFLTELTFQDPLEPINNREFLAQMAQFANLEQTRITNQNTDNLVTMSATTQSLGLLSRQIEVTNADGSSTTGTVSAVSFTSAGPSLTVTASGGSVLTDVRLAQIKLIRP